MNLLGLLAVRSFFALGSSSRFCLPDAGVAPFPELQGLCVPGLCFVLENSPTMSPLFEIKGRLRFTLKGIAFSYDTRSARQAVDGGNLSQGEDWNSHRGSKATVPVGLITG
ncbi:hypothetical protein Pyn_23292 [Prunus yedoensis var. nudiflora]|uniref:Secreted protein n=1 Tax=Prunus yedoensis var. nudiflora TaxID=2094558 RepID=A0A314V3P1_PRUYE|nr:hypothetical protein Pyn_23292 [Prunus yedoensis var. nudiflora]